MRNYNKPNLSTVMEITPPDKTYMVISLGLINPEANAEDIIQQLETQLELDYYPASLICKHSHPIARDLTPVAAQELMHTLESCGIRSMMTPSTEFSLAPAPDAIPTHSATAAQDFAKTFQIDIDETMEDSVLSVALAKNTLKLWRERLPEVYPRHLYPSRFTLKTAGWALLGLLLASFVIGPAVGFLMQTLLIELGLVPFELTGHVLSFLGIYGAIGAAVGGLLYWVYRLSHNAVLVPSAVLAALSGTIAALQWRLYHHAQWVGQDGYDLPLLQWDHLIPGMAFSALLAWLIARQQTWFYEYQGLPLQPTPITGLSLAGVQIASVALAKHNLNALLSAYANYPGNQAEVILHQHPDSPFSFIEINFLFACQYQRPQPNTLEASWCVASQPVDSTLITHLQNQQVMTPEAYFQYLRDNPAEERMPDSTGYNHPWLVSTLFSLVIVGLAFISGQMNMPPTEQPLAEQPLAHPPELPTATPEPAAHNPLKPKFTPRPERTAEQSMAKEYELERQHNINLNLSKARLALNKKDIAAALEHIQLALDEDPELSKARYLLRKVLESYAKEVAKAVKEYDIETANNIIQMATAIQTKYPNLEVPELAASQQQLNDYYRLKQHLDDAKTALTKGDYGSSLIHLTAIQHQNKDFPEYPDVSHQLAEHYLLLAEKTLLKRNSPETNRYLTMARQISQQFDLNIPSLEKRQQQLQSWGHESVVEQRSRYIGKQATIHFLDGRSLSGKIIAMDNTTLAFQRTVSGIASTHQIDWLDILKIL